MKSSNSSPPQVQVGILQELEQQFQEKTRISTYILYHSLREQFYRKVTSISHLRHKITNPSATIAANCPSAANMTCLGKESSVSRSPELADHQLQYAQYPSPSLCVNVGLCMMPELITLLNCLFVPLSS